MLTKEEKLRLLEETERKIKKEKEAMLVVLKAVRTRRKEDILKAEELLDKGLKDNWL